MTGNQHLSLLISKRSTKLTERKIHLKHPYTGQLKLQILWKTKVPTPGDIKYARNNI